MAGLVATEDFNAVVSDIYEASLSPAHWDLALTGLVNRFGRDRWDVAMLVWERTEPGGGRFIAATGVHEMARAAYLQLFAGRNLWSVRGHHLPIGTVTHSDQIVARAEFLESAFYREFLAMFGMEVALLGSLDRQSIDHLGLCLPGPPGCDVSLLEEAVRLLIPHIQRAVRISRRIGEAELAAANSTAALDRAPSAVLLLDERLGLVYANPAGRTLIAQFRLEDASGQLQLAGGTLRDQLLRLTDPADPRHCVPFRLERSGGEPLAAMAMRIDPARFGAAQTSSGTARLMVVAAHNPAVSEEGVDRVREWFALTHAEAKLALLLAEGGRIEDYCALRGVSVNAARFLLKGIFAKTGCSRQAQLVQLINASPVYWASGLPVSDLPAPVG